MVGVKEMDEIGVTPRRFERNGILTPRHTGVSCPKY
jgi:hypothetical protein